MQQVGGKNAKKKSSSDSKRHFTVVIGNKEHGLYVSSSPSSAARKAVSKLCATDKKKKVQFSIREITQGSKKKTYGPYLGEIEKLAKPIELKGRVIRYKPVAKLDKKTGKKKGGMRGGEEKIYTTNYLSYPPYFLIETKADIMKNDFYIIRLLNQLNPNLNDFMVAIPNPSPNGKKIAFKFRDDISEKLISEYLDNQVEKVIILQFFTERKIPHEVIIYLYVPYIDDTESEPRYQMREYLRYTPSSNIINRAPPYDPSQEVNYNMMHHMSIQYPKPVRTMTQLQDYLSKKGITNKEQINKIVKDYKEYLKIKYRKNLINS
jgi:hypothetical protein